MDRGGLSYEYDCISETKMVELEHNEILIKWTVVYFWMSQIFDWFSLLSGLHLFDFPY